MSDDLAPLEAQLAGLIAHTSDTARRQMARVHQFGLKDRVSRKLGAMTVKYPARQLLGITQAERAAVETIIVEHLAK